MSRMNFRRRHESKFLFWIRRVADYLTPWIILALICIGYAFMFYIDYGRPGHA